MRQLTAIAQVTFKEGIRERVFLGVIVFSVLLFLGSGFVADLSIGNILKVTQDIGLSGLSFLGLFMAIFLSTSLIAKDLDKKTVYLVVSKPIARWQYVWGKFLGLCALTTFALAIGLIAFLISLFYFWKTAPLIQTPHIAWTKHLLAFIFLNFKMFLLIAIAIFFSSFCSSSLIAFFFSFMFYLTGANLQNVKMILSSRLGEKVSPYLKAIFNFAYYFLPNLSLLDLKQAAVHNLPLNESNLILVLIYALSYTMALLFGASFIFSKKELN